MFESPRVNSDQFPTGGGYRSDSERDAAMTEASDFDIAWVRSGYEDSGTAQNVARRKNRAMQDEKPDSIGKGAAGTDELKGRTVWDRFEVFL